MSDVLRGVVKWFNNAKGFGFIEHTSGKDVFVHYSVISQEGYKSLKDGEEVEYEVKEGPKGFHATRVQRVNAPLDASQEKNAELAGSADGLDSPSGDEDSDTEEASPSSAKRTLVDSIERIPL